MMTAPAGSQKLQTVFDATGNDTEQIMPFFLPTRLTEAGSG